MKTCYPDYYNDFSCIAGKCQNSCCCGWEIDIDSQSLRKFSQVKGVLGEDLRRAISTDGTPHFILGEGERCPFLQGDGLCRLIIELGEDSICNICKEHPRFYNEYNGQTDVGLGACCEAVAQLIVSGEGATGYFLYDDGEPSENELIALRERVFDVLAGEGSLTRRMEGCLALVGGYMPEFDLSEEARFYLGLERMDSRWTEVLEELADKEAYPLEPRLSEMRFQRIAEYFVYRHFALAADMRQAALYLQFAFLSTLMVCAAGESTEDVLRLYSAEIEYSDENIDRILDRLDEALL